MLFNSFYDTLPALIRSDTKFRDFDDNSNNKGVIYWTS
jgi:hypothetical protein